MVCGHNRSKKDMYCQDLLDALNKLDKSMKMMLLNSHLFHVPCQPSFTIYRWFDDSTNDNTALRTRVAQIESMPNNRTSYAAALIPGRDTESAVRLRPAATTDCAAVTITCQPDAIQSDACQSDASTQTRFQCDAFQLDACQSDAYRHNTLIFIH